MYVCVYRYTYICVYIYIYIAIAIIHSIANICFIIIVFFAAKSGLGGCGFLVRGLGAVRAPFPSWKVEAIM